jgi:hypothetical protein
MVLEEIQEKQWQATPKIPLVEGSEDTIWPSSAKLFQVTEDSNKATRCWDWTNIFWIWRSGSPDDQK